MEVYRSEEEQVEALKKWWSENGRALLIGVFIALALVFGWRAWVDEQNTRAGIASVMYQQMVTQVEEGNRNGAAAQGRQIVEKYSGTVYAPIASLLLGKLAFEAKDLDAAAGHLRWAMENAGAEELESVARLRLAKVLHEQGQSEQALKLLATVQSGPFEAAYAEARGDIFLAGGERAKARKAYERALAGYGSVAQKQSLLQMKLDDLADVKPEKEAS